MTTGQWGSEWEDMQQGNRSTERSGNLMVCECTQLGKVLTELTDMSKIKSVIDYNGFNAFSVDCPANDHSQSKWSISVQVMCDLDSICVGVHALLYILRYNVLNIVCVCVCWDAECGEMLHRKPIKLLDRHNPVFYRPQRGFVKGTDQAVF